LHCGWLNGANPMMPHHRMVLSGNTLYGTAPGGSHGGGLVFKIGTDGSGFTVLKQLGVPLADAGAFPGPLTLAENNVYGALEHGGRTGRTSWEGAFFKVGTDGSGFGFIKRLTRAEGAKTTAAPVFVSGALYGVAPQGGGGNKGTLFRLSADGAEFAVLKEFGADEPN